MKEYFIGVDLGGTKILTAVSDSKGNIIEKVKVATEALKGQEQVINNIVRSIEEVLKKSNIDKKEIIRMGLGTPGPLNINEGLVYEAPNLNWKNVAIVDILKEKTGIDINLENDANAAALGEKWFGAGRNVDNMIYMTVSTGIGGGIIIDKKILHGVSDTAGEIGHFVIQTDGPICGCGNHGCFEAVASGTAVNRIGMYLAAMHPDSLLYSLVDGDITKIDGKVISEAAIKGDKYALQIWDDEARYLGIGIANLINIFNTGTIVLGGGVMNSWDLIIDKMTETIKDYAFESAYTKVDIKKSSLGDEVGVQGAIAVAMGDRLLS
ncbi:ROK family protein [Natronospora cellulosivora (SeqCode)]